MLELAYQTGHSLDEMAEITGASLGNVKKHMFQARKTLRRHLTTLEADAQRSTIRRFDPGSF
jgi:DNA-directed RNA polymerase specialized sigma24 family protein